VFPSAIEEEIKLLPWVEHAMIYGLNMPYTICIICPDFAVLEKYAKENGLSSDPKELVNNDQVKNLIETEIANHLDGKFGRYEVPKKFILLSEGFSVENGMLTQTLKLKRRFVLKENQDKIDALYSR